MYTGYGLVVISLLIPCLMAFNTNGDSLPDLDIWAPEKMDKLWTPFILDCHKTGVDIDMTEQNEKVKECLTPLLEKYLKVMIMDGKNQMEKIKSTVKLFQDAFSGKTLRGNETKQIQDAVEHYCEVGPKAEECVRGGQKYVIEHCSVAKELDLKIIEFGEIFSRQVCQNGGKRVTDFITKRGPSCFENYQMEVRRENCFENLTKNSQNPKFRLKDGAPIRKEDFTVADLCEATDIVGPCLLRLLDTCPENKEASKAVHSIVDDSLKEWKYSCNGSASSNILTNYIAFLFTTLTLAISSIF